MEGPNTNKSTGTRAGTPFEDLKQRTESGSWFSLVEAKNNLNLVVKELKPEYQMPVWNAEEMAKEIKSYSAFLRDPQFGIADNVPNVRPVVGESNGQKTLFLVVDKIEGRTLEKTEEEASESGYVPELSPEEGQTVRHIVDKLVDIYTSTFDGEKGQIIEIYGDDNFMRGKNRVRRDSEDKIYLIDMYPIFHEAPQEVKRHLDAFCATFGFLQEQMAGTYAKVQKLMEHK